MKRRIVALALALSMLLAMLPVMPTTAYAAESTAEQTENYVLTVYCETTKETFTADSDGRIELSLEKVSWPHDKTFLGWGDSPEGPVLYNVDDVLYLDQDKTIYGVHEEAKEIIDSCTETQPWMDLELKQYQCWFPNVLKFVPNATTSYCFERFAEGCVSHFALYSDVGSVLTSSTSNGNPDDIEYRLEYPLTAGEVYYVHFLRYDGSAESFRGRISRGFKITYDANGGSDVPEATYVYSNIDGNLSADIPTGTGTFLGWSTDPDAAVAEYAAGAAFPLRADTTLYAVWEAAECAHSFGQWYETEAPACMAEGTQRRDCANCDHFETQPIPATGHSFGEWYESVAATCTSEGQKRRDCANCDGYQTQKIAMTGHNHTAVVTAPTCTEGGYTTYTCDCGDSYVADETEAAGHSWGEWYETKAPTTTAAGEERRDCANCDAYETRKVDPVTHEHSYTAVVTAPTCTEGGYTTYTCDCGDSYVGDETEAVGHSFGEWYRWWDSSTERRDCAICNAYETKKSGTCGENLTWVYESRSETLTISGTGDMRDYERDSDWESSWTTSPMPDYANNIIIEEGVTSIGNWAFAHLSCINCDHKPVSITIPSTVTRIGESAFKYREIEAVYAASLSSWLMIDSEDELLSSTKLYIDGEVVTSVIVPENVTHIGKNILSNYDKLTSIRIPDSVTSIGEQAFYNCDALTEVVIGSGVTEIGKDAFHGCDSLRGINIDTENTVYASENGVLYNKDKTVVIDCLTAYSGDYVTPESVTRIEEYAFDDCDGLDNVVISDNVVSVGANAFYHSNLRTVTIGTGIEVIEECTFQSCQYLERVTIPEGVREIKEEAFSYNTKLVSVSIPVSLNTIGTDAFEECYNLQEVYITDLVSWMAITYGEDEASPLLAGAHSGRFKDKHLYLNGELLTEVLIPEGVTAIGDYAFCACRDIISITIPEGVTSVGEKTFAYCNALTSIDIPGSVTSIGNSAFYSCDKLSSVTISKGVTSIGDSAFSDCYELTSIDIPGSVTSIGNSAFYSCDKLSSVTISKGVTSIGEKTFEFCSALTSIDIPDSVTSIGNSAFYSCNKLSSVTISKGVTSIGEETFAFCSALTSIDIPGSVTSIDYKAFFKCRALTSVTICEGVRSIGVSAFNQCTGLTSITLPESLTKISKSAFNGCSTLVDVYYAGTENMKGAINIGDNNTYLINATWHCQEPVELIAPTVKISGNTTTGKPKLSWSAVSGADFYRIYRATSRTGTYKYHKSTTSTSYTDTEATAGTNYYYKIKAVVKDTDETSGWSNIVNRCCDLRKPVVTLKVDTASGKPKVTFEKISGTEKYYIVRATSKTGTYSKLASITGTSYIDTTAKAGKTYYYKVKALHENDAADSVYSDVTSRVCDLAKPAVSLSVNTATGKPVVKWETVSGAAKYRVYRSTSKDSGYELVYTAVSARTYTDKTAEAGTNYYYKVRAIHENADANSAYSKVVNRVCDLAKPVVSITRSDGDPKISWETVEGAEKYEIWRATSTYGTYKKVKTAISARSFTDTSAVAGKTYYYKVRAIHSNSAANSAYSAIKSITAK